MFEEFNEDRKSAKADQEAAQNDESSSSHMLQQAKDAGKQQTAGKKHRKRKAPEPVSAGLKADEQNKQSGGGMIGQRPRSEDAGTSRAGPR